MSQNTIENLKINPETFSALGFITKRFRRQNFLGLFLSITGFLLLIGSIILLSTVGLIGVLAILPVPLLLIPGLWSFISITRSGAITSYNKVKSLYKKKDLEALKHLLNLRLKDDNANILTKNFLQSLFSVAAFIDLNDSNSTLLAMQFYRACINDGFKKDDVKVILEVLAIKQGKTSIRDYIGW
ncbi:MAG TPA: hypothetical protein VMZ29_15690 [Candidatus Bathyarchaeia archaeon]|nr:hypothetical protein [Candidatus Bathyarchaeia archaeon]